MGSWSREAVKLPVIKFDGDDVQVSIKRLLMEDMLTLSQYYDKATGGFRFQSHLEVCTAAANVLPKYITEFSGLKVEGTDMTKETFFNEACKEFYFVPLLGELLGHLIRISTAGGELEKKPDAPVAQS